MNTGLRRMSNRRNIETSERQRLIPGSRYISGKPGGRARSYNYMFTMHCWDYSTHSTPYENFVDQFIMCKDCRYKVWASGWLIYVYVCLRSSSARLPPLRHNQQTFHKLCFFLSVSKDFLTHTCTS